MRMLNKYSAVFGFILTGLILSSCVNQQDTIVPQNKIEMDVFVDSLMNIMTLEEKIGQMNLLSIGFDVTGPLMNEGVEEKIKNGLVGGVFNSYTPDAIYKLQKMAVEHTRLHIPLIFGYDVIHGYKTTFPIPLALSCTWDMDLIERSARIAATESSADGVNWTFSPMVDIARDPRWGRVSEGSGEDSYLGSQIATAMVHGYQGNNLADTNTIMACVKHFALYGAGEAGRDYNTVDMSMLRMYNEYLPPYKAAVDAGVGSVMSAFNEINGVPATSNYWLMTELLRKDWGFDGFVVTDYTAVKELIKHGVGANLKEASALAINAGIDMDMVDEGFVTYGVQLVNEKKISEAAINQACRLILQAKYKLGLFSNPYLYVSHQRSQQAILTPENRAAAKEMAANSIVLLKNSGNLLPLKNTGKIALVGPLADNKRELIGSWSAAGDPALAVSVNEGLRNLAPELNIQVAKGCNLLTDLVLLRQLSGDQAIDIRTDDQMIAEAVAVTKSSDLCIAVLGEPAGLSGEASSRTDLSLPGRQQELLKALVATGKPVILVLMSGRPLTLEWENDHVPAILEAWHGGLEAGNAVAEVLLGKHNPSGKLTMTFPRNVGQIPLFYNHKNTGRPEEPGCDPKYVSRYIDVENSPLYPFGYGLSYSSFEYSNLNTNKTNFVRGDSIKVFVTLTNKGPLDGYEVSQLYVQDLIATLTRPVQELKGFQKVFLRSGESKTLEFVLPLHDLGFYHANSEYYYEPGFFKIMVGGNCVETLETEIQVVD
ncbi:MAG: beta-glucosidase BglX [Bacteroidales bacterium]|nr:beta-glucosidase BglX [Bacteroidales bacterium]